MNFEIILWLFLIYAFLGWCIEVVYHTFVLGGFANCGMLSGPYCPIYGFGALAVVYAVMTFEDNLLILFLCSALLASILELITGYLMDVIFKQRWWDYTKYPFNIGGYICLQFSLAWGLAGVVMVKIVHPPVLNLVYWLSSQLGVIVLAVIFTLFLIDFIASIAGLLNIKHQLVILDKINEKIKSMSNGLGGKISNASKNVGGEINDLRVKQNETVNYLRRKTDRLLKAFPDSKVKQILQQPVGTIFKNNKKSKK